MGANREPRKGACPDFRNREPQKGACSDFRYLIGDRDLYRKRCLPKLTSQLHAHRQVIEISIQGAQQLKEIVAPPNRLVIEQPRDGTWRPSELLFELLLGKVGIEDHAPDHSAEVIDELLGIRVEFLGIHNLIIARTAGIQRCRARHVDPLLM